MRIAHLIISLVVLTSFPIVACAIKPHIVDPVKKGEPHMRVQEDNPTLPHPRTRTSAAPMPSLAPGALKTMKDAPLVPDPGAVPISPPGGMPVGTPAGRVKAK